jgi:hypothetical protein
MLQSTSAGWVPSDRCQLSWLRATASAARQLCQHFADIKTLPGTVLFSNAPAD